jgi:hypothetical protein
VYQRILKRSTGYVITVRLILEGVRFMHRDMLDCGMSCVLCSPLKHIKQMHCQPQHTPHSESYGNLLRRIGLHHRLNMEVVVQSLFGLHVT